MPERPEQKADAVVIGSGFGGAVAACRLAQAGFAVCLIERGRRYEAGDFPRPPVPGYAAERSTADLFWSVDGGLFETRDLRGMQVVQAAGYGGGSLIYANVHMRAPARAFGGPGAAGPWPNDGPDPIDHETLDPYYRLAASMLEVSPAPAEWPRPQYMADLAARLGREARHFRPNLAVNFTGDEPLDSIADPGEDPDAAPPAGLRPVKGRRNRFGRPQGRCVACAHCDLGCRYHAKNTLDLNYLAVAAERGATVRTEAEVRAIARDGEGYVVEFWDRRFGADRVVRAPYVFVCAGAVNTTELLLRSWDRISDDPPPAALGRRFSGNGDSIGIVFGTRDPAHAERGPVIATTTVYDRAEGDADDGFCVIQDAGLPRALLPLLDVLGYGLPHATDAEHPPKRGLDWLRAHLTPIDRELIDVMPPLLGRLEARLGRLRAEGVRRTSRLVSGLITEGGPIRLLRRQWIENIAHRTLEGMTSPEKISTLAAHFVGDFDGETEHRALLLGMGLDPVTGRLVIDPDGRLVASRSAVGAHRIYQLQERLMYDLAARTGGRLRINPIWGALRRPITVHPMGGCPMGRALRGEGEPDGVVDRYGEAYAAPGLYVLDAAAFPGAVGVNPSATILAVAERNIERFIRRRGVETDDAERASWTAPEMPRDCDAEPPPEPLYAITEPAGNSAPPTTQAVGVRFVERLEGYFDPTPTPGLAVPFDGDGPTVDCLDGERRGLMYGSAQRVALELTCETDDLDGFLASQQHPLRVTGHARIGERLWKDAVTGTLQLMAPAGPRARYLEYDLTIRCDTVRLLFGRKPVRDDPGFDAIRDLTTVYCALADFGVAPEASRPVGPVRAARLGIMRVHLADFVHHQLGTIEVTGGPKGDPDEELLVEAWYTSRFARFFFGETLQVYSDRLRALLNPGTRRPHAPRGPEPDA